MQPHEWANQITRASDQDIRTAEGIIAKLERIRELGNQFRHVTVMQGETSRMVDDTSVQMSITSRELENIKLKLDEYFQNFSNALMM